ncbi:MAG: glycoside hydrolase family 9 protein [Verrucomicrobiota bacterium]
MLERRGLRISLGLVLSLLLANVRAADLRLAGNNPLRRPAVGDHGLHILSPTVLELTLITTKDPDPAPVKEWNFVGTNAQLTAPAAGEFLVTAGVRPMTVKSVGFKRRVLYAPLKQRDLRIGNHLYLELAAPVSEGQRVEVRNPSSNLWPTNLQFAAVAGRARLSPAIHVNQTGYLPALPKKAMVGYYLGSLGEMKIPAQDGFRLVEARSGREVFQGRLAPRCDRGFNFPCYQEVQEADFSTFRTPGEYRLLVPGLGVSYPFYIDDGVAAAFARAYALGLYHQRCGVANTLPFTRHIHGPCHTATAEVPTASSTATQRFLKSMSDDYAANRRHTAPQLKDVSSSLYPFVNSGRINVAGGHHDAGDYSKYTINSAALIHYLVLAADAFPGAGALDNLGLPESSDGKSDLLQEAKWEADFLARMQDADGGFYFLVYPRGRAYEDNVLPDQGDPQVVFPKNTAATAVAVAALAQASSSPLFRRQFPEAAALYLQKARLGWGFLEGAIARHGRDGAYQKISHYGNEFMHDDELAWAATELFLATGDARFQANVLARFDPADRNTRRWTWWRLFDGYGCAVRSFALAARTGRMPLERLDPVFVRKCQAELLAAAQDQYRYTSDSAYGTAFPEADKQFRNAGWYFSVDRAFDLAVASLLDYPALNDPRPGWVEAIISNVNYEGGGNPVNVSYLTGLGWKRPREIVHQYAQNDRRVLPPSGIPLGNIQAGFQVWNPYRNELNALSFPADGDESKPYPFYDRWGDSFNVTTEFVIVNQARGLATLALLMAMTPLKNQPWKASSAYISGMPARVTAQQAVTARFIISDRKAFDLSKARVVWEAQEQEPAVGTADGTFSFIPRQAGDYWLEAEAHWPDGRRLFAATQFTVREAEERQPPPEGTREPAVPHGP